MKRRFDARTAWAIFVLTVFAAWPVFFAAGQAKASPVPGSWAITIVKSDITPTAKFYSVKIDGKPVEIFAVRASDGSIRTALNTCQICYASGRGYYIQEGSVFICQNCGNRFSLDQIGKVRGGCNPIPILGKDKKDMGDFIGVSETYLRSVTPYFAKWKKN